MLRQQVVGFDRPHQGAFGVVAGHVRGIAVLLSDHKQVEQTKGHYGAGTWDAPCLSTPMNLNWLLGREDKR